MTLKSIAVNAGRIQGFSLTTAQNAGSVCHWVFLLCNSMLLNVFSKLERLLTISTFTMMQG